MKANILIVEDEPAIQELIKLNLELSGYSTEQAYSAEQARTHINTRKPDLVLLDWMLPGSSGISLAKWLRSSERTNDLPIIMLTAKTSEENAVEGLEAGADDYISKPFSPKELIARIKAVLRRRAPQLTQDEIVKGSIRLNPTTHHVFVEQQSISLGPIEFRLLHFLMVNPERVFSRSQLLDNVWGDHVFVEERTVDVHIRRLRKALELNNAHTHIQTVRGAGYKFTARIND